MRKIIIGILAALMVSACQNSGRAADLPVKAIGQPYPTRGCGWYYGITAEAGAGTVTGAPVGTTIVGGDVGGLVGYACPTSSLAPWFVEGIIAAQNLNGSSNGLSVTGPLHGEVRGGFQTPLLGLLSAFNLNLPTPQPISGMLPPGASLTGSPQNYLFAAVNFDDISAQVNLGSGREWLTSLGGGTGILQSFRLSNGTIIVGDTWVEAEFQSNAFCVGNSTTCPKLGTRWVIGQSFKY